MWHTVLNEGLETLLQNSQLSIELRVVHRFNLDCFGTQLTSCTLENSKTRDLDDPLIWTVDLCVQADTSIFAVATRTIAECFHR